MKVLTITTLFPFANNPKHGIFVETRLRHLQRYYPDVELRVIAPIPYFPSEHPVFGAYAEYAKAPAFEIRHGIPVYHPRYLVVPKMGMTLTPRTLAASIAKQIEKIVAEGYDFDLIDGHDFYPDGVAIANIAKQFNKPFTMTARGTDINLIPQFDKPKRQIQQVLQQSDHNIAVCEALRQEMISLGSAPQKVTTLRNGVDLDLFNYSDTDKQRRLRQKFSLPLDRPVILSVGHLIERKGHHLVIEAVSRIPNVQLIVAGDGPDRKKLERLAANLDCADRVKFVGSLSQTELSNLYGAADLLVLASSREGWANVLLESMSCGTPVVATNIWGTPEVVQTENVGTLVERNADDIRNGITAVLARSPERINIRKYAENFSWHPIAQAQYAIFSAIAESQ